MAKRFKADKQNAAIVDKVKRVLDSTDYIDTVRIVIEGSRGEVPTITYCIKEFITPDEEGDTE